MPGYRTKQHVALYQSSVIWVGTYRNQKGYSAEKTAMYIRATLSAENLTLQQR